VTARDPLAEGLGRLARRGALLSRNCYICWSGAIPIAAILFQLRLLQAGPRTALACVLAPQQMKQRRAVAELPVTALRLLWRSPDAPCD
jgi:hypothetical protein